MSIQFDDLFKKAWEEDAFSELETDGVYYQSCSISIIITYIKFCSHNRNCHEDHSAGSESPKAEVEPKAKASKSNEAQKGLETDITVLDEILSSAKTAILTEEEITGNSNKQLQKEVRKWILNLEISFSLSST